MIRFTYPRAALRQFARVLALSGAAALATAACSAGVKPPPTGTGGNGGSGSGTGGAQGTAGATGSGTAGSFSFGGAGGSSSSDAGCQVVDYHFDPKIPTVFLLVDRSGSEFTSETTGTYFTLRSAVLQVIQQLQSQVRFGFAAFVGDKSLPNNAGCPAFTSVPAKLDNYADIAAAYNGVGPLLPYGKKADTPAFQAIPLVKAALQADTGTGQKFMLFVTDSETDFCDDGGQLCPADAVTYQIQSMYDAGFGTLIVGLPFDMNISAGVLQNFANAGAGQGVINPPGSGAATLMDIYYQCTGAGSGQWMNLWTAAGRTGLVPIAKYGTTPGTASVYSPTSTSQQALYDQIAAALSDVKSCVFDLSDVGGKSIRVVTSKLDRASVSIEGMTQPMDSTNGWSMVSATQLQLNGSACEKWRDMNSKNIEFNFPCESIVVD